ncbi:hypothetical protein TcWFU_003565 [Taenia crassiceps]|uniref:Uncharacterized protein n=1 Tax=Taenia crassiceps TaxID=6207 RepID=A0ABR4QDF7_9CEST
MQRLCRITTPQLRKRRFLRPCVKVQQLCPTFITFYPNQRAIATAARPAFAAEAKPTTIPLGGIMGSRACCGDAVAVAGHVGMGVGAAACSKCTPTLHVRFVAPLEC